MIKNISAVNILPIYSSNFPFFNQSLEIRKTLIIPNTQAIIPRKISDPISENIWFPDSETLFPSNIQSKIKLNPMNKNPSDIIWKSIAVNLINSDLFINES